MGDEFTPDEMEEYESQLRDTDLKAILIDIASTNRAIYQQLALLNSALEEPEEEATLYECDHCGTKVWEDERREHATNAHSAPESISLETVFTVK